MGTAWDPQKFRSEIAARGEAYVRNKLDGRGWGGPEDERVQVAKEWLWEQERKRADAASAENRWRADRAFYVSIAALVISVLGIAVPLLVKIFSTTP